MYIVYQFFNTTNGKIYIGKSSSNKDRVAQHRRVATGGKEIYGSSFSIIHKAIVKYGDAIEFSILQEFSSETEAFEAEKYWIAFYKTNVSKYGSEFGYNATDGGEGLSGFKFSLESRERLSKAKTGLPSPNKGIPRSEEQKRKISATLKGRPISRETKEKMSLTRKSMPGIADAAHAARKRFSKDIEREITAKYLAGCNYKILLKEYSCSSSLFYEIIKRNK